MKMKRKTNQVNHLSEKCTDLFDGGLNCREDAKQISCKTKMESSFFLQSLSSVSSWCRRPAFIALAEPPPSCC